MGRKKVIEGSEWDGGVCFFSFSSRVGFLSVVFFSLYKK
jgi:hypothetical protein